MSSREDILQSIRRATHVKYEKPDLKPLEDMALTYPSKVEQFYLIMKQVGGEAILLEKEEDVNDFIKKAYPGAKRIASNLKTITCATFNPDDVEDPAELNGTDLAVIDGKIGVAENGAVWIEQDVKQRAIYFIIGKGAGAGVPDLFGWFQPFAGYGGYKELDMIRNDYVR